MWLWNLLRYRSYSLICMLLLFGVGCHNAKEALTSDCYFYKLAAALDYLKRWVGVAMGQPRKGKPIPKVVDKIFLSVWSQQYSELWEVIAVITWFKNSVKIYIFEREILKSHNFMNLNIDLWHGETLCCTWLDDIDVVGDDADVLGGRSQNGGPE